MADKSRIDSLVIFGGPEAINETLHVGRPNSFNRDQRDRFIERIEDILDRQWLTNDGPYVKELERRLADMAGVRHCIAICNGTIALEIAIQALGLDGEVIIPSFTFIATAHALQWLGITPIFCDIDPATHNIDPRRVEAAITPRTTGIIGVHLWGRPCDVPALNEIAERHQLKLVFDAAHAFGCSLGGRTIGSFGDAEVFSFHATKFFTTSEGGAVMTNDDELASKIRLMRNFGFSGYDRVVSQGTNGKMSEITAALGLASLESVDELIATNKSNYHHYREGLSSIPGVRLVDYDERENCNFQYVVIEIDSDVTEISRDYLLQVLHAENVMARRYFYPGCHRMEPYLSLYPNSASTLPETDRLSERVIALPTGTAVTTEQIALVCQVIRTVVSHGAAIQRHLSESNSETSTVAAPRDIRTENGNTR